MVRESLDGSLRHLAEVGALALGASAFALLGLALLAELLRRARRAPALVAELDRLVPLRLRVAAVAALALLPTLGITHPAGADGSVRGWLGTAPPTAASPTTGTVAPAATPSTPPTTAPVATRGSIDQHDHAPVADPGVVLAPALVVTADPPPAPPLPAAPPTPALAPGEQYAVVTGDCLWSITARRLGAGATNQAVDAGWRALYAANRAAIGTDPGLIHPGLVLVLPPLTPQP